MKNSMKYALGAAILWIGIIWILGIRELGGANILFYEDWMLVSQFVTWVVGLLVIAGLYFLFRKNID